jgi:hypothetical protein
MVAAWWWWKRKSEAELGWEFQNQRSCDLMMYFIPAPANRAKQHTPHLI